jgi:site-specific recombinase XerD
MTHLERFAIGGSITPELADRAREYFAASKAFNTRRAYRASWRIFVAWCAEHGVDALPASSSTVVAFLVAQADTVKVSTLEVRLAAIRKAHELAGLPSPTPAVEVVTVMAGIRRRHGTRPTKMVALMVGDVIAVCRRLEGDLRGHRDRALILLGFAAGLRRSELVGLDVTDISFRPEGMIMNIGQSKTDQIAAGRAIGIGHGTDGATCPVTAVREWLRAGGISGGALFRGIDRHGRVRAGRLSARSVARIVKRRAALVGLDPGRIAGHSLRSGFASSAAAAGIEERDIARVTGHKSLSVLRGYMQAGTLFDGDVVRRLGL